MNDSDHPSRLVESNDDVRDASKEPTAQGVALVTQLVDVTWGDAQTSVEVRDALPPGRFAIRTGHAQIEFFCGATLVVEGPAELDHPLFEWQGTQPPYGSGSTNAQDNTDWHGFDRQLGIANPAGRPVRHPQSQRQY